MIEENELLEEKELVTAEEVLEEVSEPEAVQEEVEEESPESKTEKLLEQLKKKVDQRDREIEALVDYQQRTAQREYEKAKQDLQARLSASKDDMDVEGVAHYTKELTRLEQIEQSNQANSRQEQQRIALEGFRNRNQHWFNDQNPELVSRAVELDNQLKQKHPNASFEDLAEMIELKMLKEYPEKVLKSRSARAPSVITSNSAVNKTVLNRNNVTFKKLSQEHRDTYNVYKRINPNITEADFINRLKQDGEL